jgi:hypothetical protein
MSDIDWMKDLDCLQAFAEKYESWFHDFCFEYERDLKLAQGDTQYELNRDEIA